MTVTDVISLIGFFLHFFVLFYYFLDTTLVSVDIMSWWSTSYKTVGFVNSG